MPTHIALNINENSDVSVNCNPVLNESIGWASKSCIVSV